MKNLILLFILLQSSILFGQLYIYPNEVVLPGASELLAWNNATVNITIDNLQNQITDSTFNILRKITPVGSSLSFNTEQYFVSDTISTNTTYNLSNITKKGIVTLFLYSTVTSTVSFTFSGGNLYAPYSLTNFSAEANKFNVVQFLVVNPTNIMVVWQQQLTKIN